MISRAAVKQTKMPPQSEQGAIGKGVASEGAFRRQDGCLPNQTFSRGCARPVFSVANWQRNVPFLQVSSCNLDGRIEVLLHSVA